MNTKLICGLSLLIFFSLIGATIFQLIDVSEKSYLVGKAEVENEGIEGEISELRVSLSESAHLENFEEKVLDEGFEKVGKIEYLTVSASGDLAVK